MHVCIRYAYMYNMCAQSIHVQGEAAAGPHPEAGPPAVPVLLHAAEPRGGCGGGAQDEEEGACSNVPCRKNVTCVLPWEFTAAMLLTPPFPHFPAFSHMLAYTCLQDMFAIHMLAMFEAADSSYVHIRAHKTTCSVHAEHRGVPGQDA